MTQSLSEHLVKLNLFAGPPGPKDYISNSGLSEIKRVLTNGQKFLGKEEYLIFGSETHARFLEKKSKHKVDSDTSQAIRSMIISLNKNKFVASLMENSITEVEYIKKVYDVNFKVIIDIRGKKGKFKNVGADLKTTSAKTESEFIKLALNKYDYLRQGHCYEMAEGLDEFYFIGIQKHKPYNVYILDVNNYEGEKKRSIKETQFLVEFYKNFGRVKVEGSESESSPDCE